VDTANKLQERIGGATPKFLGGPNPSLHLSPSFPFTVPPPLPFPSIPLEVGPLNRGRGLGHFKLPQWGLGRSPSRKRIWCILALKSDIWRLLRINRPQCRINEHTGQLLVGPNALWPTQLKFWEGHGPPCSAPHARTFSCLMFPSQVHGCIINLYCHGHLQKIFPGRITKPLHLSYLPPTPHTVLFTHFSCSSNLSNLYQCLYFDMISDSVARTQENIAFKISF